MTGSATMTTTHAMREAGSRCGRRMARATKPRWIAPKSAAPSSVSI